MSGALSAAIRRRRGRDLTVPEVSGILDFALWSDTGTLSIPDRKSSPLNPATQATAARKPVMGVASNGIATATLSTTLVRQFSWPKATNNHSTQQWAWATWFKAVSYPAYKCLLSVGGATGAYDNCRSELYLNNNRSAELYFFGQDTTGYNGRKGLTAANALPAAGTWCALYLQFDGTQIGDGTGPGIAAAEPLRHRIYIDWSLQTLTFSNTGSPGSTPLLLRTNAANVPIVIGNFSNTSDATYATDCVLGGRIWQFNAVPSSLADVAAMMNQYKPVG